MKTKVNSKIAPVERFGISTPARSRGSNRDSRLQKKFQIDQEVDPALRFARSQHSTLCYARAAEGGAGEEERRRNEGTGEGAKEVARAAGGKAAGAWVIGE